MRDLLTKDAIWNWTGKHSEAYKALKHNFASTVCLNHIIPHVSFKLQTDASVFGISGVLFQIDWEKNYCIISIVSHCLTSVESRYTTTELELLAIVYSVTKFRHYLIGARFEIITDHKSLMFLNSTVYHNSRLIRWTLLLQQYSYSVSYCRGTDNIVADFFSRNPGGKFHEEISDKVLLVSLDIFCSPVQNNKQISTLVIMMVHQTNNSLKSIVKNFKIKQYSDNHCKKIIEAINNNNVESMENYQLYNEVLFCREKNNNSWKIVIPSEIKKELISQTHSKLGHPGVYKTWLYIKRFYFWKAMKKDIKKFVKSCDVCQRVKYLSIAMKGEYQMVHSGARSDLVTVDFYGPLPRARGGAEYVLVVLDAFSKLVRLYAMKRATAQMSVKKIIENYIPECGKTLRISSDNGTQFRSPKWKNTLEREGIKVIYSSIRHPQSNPTERVMREIGRLFRTYCNNRHTTWANHLKTIENILNITTHYSTECTPFEIHYGKPIVDEILKLVRFPESNPLNHEYLIEIAKKSIKKTL